MAKPVSSVTVVGGGTAGWMTAAMLDAMLNRQSGRESVAVELIESPDAPTIGVGEATVQAMPRALAAMGIDETEFFRRCNVSYKLGVLFDGWDVGADGEPVQFLNPFTPEPVLRSVPVSQYFQRFAQPNQRYDYCTDLARSVAMACKGPMSADPADPRTRVNYAFHFDAGEFARLLRDTAIERGVMHTLDHLEEVEQDENGFISALNLRAGGRRPVQLVIDCTGFQGLIINKALGEPFESYGDKMMNDRALALQIPHPPGSKLEPQTRSTALGAGWAWRAPLYHRIGTGYVFSSAYRSDDEAIVEFLDHIGLSDKDVTPRAIPMRVGRTRRSWVKNCVAIGLSGGFVEPLESTAIFIVDMAIRWLEEYFPRQDFPPEVAERYNRNMKALYEEITDFIALHYHLSNRPGDYWREARDAKRAPERLLDNLELWRHVLPASRDLATEYIFPQDTYKAVLFGKNFYADVELPRGGPLKHEHWEQFLQRGQALRAQLIGELPDHRALLAVKRGEAARKTPHAMLNKGAKPDVAGAPTVRVPTVKPSSDGALL